MASRYESTSHIRPILLPCPVCGTPLAFGLLEIPEDDGEVVQLFTFDCPTGDFHRPLTKSKITGILAHEVVKRLQR